MAQDRTIRYPPADFRINLQRRRRVIDEVGDRGTVGRDQTDVDRILTPYSGLEDDDLMAGDPASPGGTKVTFEELDDATQLLILSSGGGGDKPLVFEFDRTTAPTLLGAFSAGDMITNTEVEILEVFDDPAAWIQCGTVLLGGSAILAQAHIKMSKLGNYANQENFKITGDDKFNFNISPGTSTQGRGRVVVDFRRA